MLSKVVVGLGTAVLVGCASPPPQAPAQAIAPVASDPDGLQHDQTPALLVAGVPLKQRGLASWYGKKFNGRRTSSGARFSALGFTAAHRTLPISSYVRVRRVTSGEEVIVRINDRGPFHSGRVLDLSYAAARRLGIAELGSAEVETELLTEE